MIECVACLYKDNHPLGILFNEEGLCSGCTLHQEKDILNWGERRESLLKIVKDYRNQSSYDCIVPVTGGQDSYFTVHYVVNELGLRPLLVNFNRVFNSREGIENLQRLRTVFGLDLQQATMNPVVVKRIIQTTLANLGTINWFWIAGQTSLPVRISRDLGVPLIIWGAHQGVEQVGMYSHLDDVEMTRRYRKEHDLMGVDEKEIFRFDCAFNEADISQLQYPSDLDLLNSNTKGIYLSNYVRWDPYQQHEFVVKRYGYQGRKFARSYYQFDNPDCPVYMTIQDELKQMKFGYGKVTDQLTREIRHGRIDREKAKSLNNSYLEKTDSDSILKFLEWLGASRRSYKLLELNSSKDFAEKLKEFLISDSRRYEDVEQSQDRDYDVFGKGVFID